MTRTLLLAAMLSTLAGAVPATATSATRSTTTSADDVVWTTVMFDLAVDANGEITRLEALPSTNPNVAETLMPRIHHWRFQAVDAGGQSASAETTLYVYLRGERADSDSVTVRIANAYTGPRAIHKPVPRYPGAALRSRRSGGVMAKMTVDADGRTTAVEPIAELSDQRFMRSAVAALSDWRFEPERIDGRPVAASVRVPVVYRIHGEQPELKWKDDNARQPDDALAALNSPVQLLAADF